MIVPSKQWPFVYAPEVKQEKEENIIMVTRRKVYSLLQSRAQESDDYNVNIVSTVRIKK